MKILITGGCGFVGSNLVDLLVEDSSNSVIVVDNLDTGKREYCNAKAEYIFEEVSRKFLGSSFKNFPFDTAPPMAHFKYSTKSEKSDGSPQ